MGFDLVGSVVLGCIEMCLIQLVEKSCFNLTGAVGQFVLGDNYHFRPSLSTPDHDRLKPDQVSSNQTNELRSEKTSSNYTSKKMKGLSFNVHSFNLSNNYIS